MILSQVPGRICFFGDHQDYLGLPVIAGTIDRYIKLEALPQKKAAFSLVLPDLGETREIALSDASPLAPNDYYRSALHTLKKEGICPDQGYQVTLKGDLPINSGLSSSSAVVVAWIRFLVDAFGKKSSYTAAQIGRWAYESEVLNFNQPGGMMDQYTIAQGGLGFLETTVGDWTPLTPKLGPLVVAVSGIEKQTLGVLAGAKNDALEALAILQKKVPDFDLYQVDKTSYARYKTLLPVALQPFWYATVENYLITRAAAQELQKPTPDTDALGALMNAHQHILKTCIQNTPKPMDTMMAAALKAGAIGAKIVGSGGGGAMVAMVPESALDDVCEAFVSQGATAAFPVQLTAATDVYSR